MVDFSPIFFFYFCRYFFLALLLFGGLACMYCMSVAGLHGGHLADGKRLLEPADPNGTPPPPPPFAPEIGILFEAIQSLIPNLETYETVSVHCVCVCIWYNFSLFVSMFW